MLTIQLLERFQYIHSKTFIHRDIKPDNFLIGMKENSHIVYVVDYGLAKRYYDPKTKQHIAYRNDKSLTGTARYASIHAHLGEELSRRDDIEAVGFVMLYFFKGQLPWQNLPAFNKSDKYRKIKETKIKTKLEDLCQDCPPEFLTYMKYCRNLDFEQKPNYQYLIDLMKGLAQKSAININDRRFDWVIKEEKLGKQIVNTTNLSDSHRRNGKDKNDEKEHNDASQF